MLTGNVHAVTVHSPEDSPNTSTIRKRMGNRAEQRAKMVGLRSLGDLAPPYGLTSLASAQL
jgi:hypothetical protein